MPITASSGALTYARVSSEVDSEYWFIQPTTASTFNFLTVSSSNIYLSSYASGDYINFMRIEGTSNPAINYNKQYYNQQGLFSQAQFYSDGTTAKVAGWVRDLHPSGFPRQSVLYGYSADITLSTGAITNDYKLLPRPTPGASPDQLQLILRQYATDGTNDWYTFQYDAAVDPVYAGLNLNNTNAIQFNEGGTPSTTVQFTSGLKLDASGNPIVLYTRIPTLGTIYDAVLKKIDKTPTGGNPDLPELWEIVFSNATNDIKSSDLQLDSSDNSYITMYDETDEDGYLAKVNTSGTLQWQVKVTNTKLYGVYLKSDTEIFVVGMTDTDRLWVAEFNDSGTIQWQNEMIGTVAFTNPASTEDSVAKIHYDNDDLYIGGNGGYNTNTFVLKVPADGSIPQNGEYVFTDGSINTYQTSSQTVATGSLTTTGVSNTINHFVTTNNSSPAPTVGTLSDVKNIAFPLL